MRSECDAHRGLLSPGKTCGGDGVADSGLVLIWANRIWPAVCSGLGDRYMIAVPPGLHCIWPCWG